MFLSTFFLNVTIGCQDLLSKNTLTNPSSLRFKKFESSQKREKKLDQTKEKSEFRSNKSREESGAISRQPFNNFFLKLDQSNEIETIKLQLQFATLFDLEMTNNFLRVLTVFCQFKLDLTKSY